MTPPTSTPNQTRAAAFRSLNGQYDVLILGGGATGLGIAVDAATRGFKTALVEAGDFAQATSSRSTKLVHGGVRYLATGQVHLVREALHERAVMRRAAPHLVHPLPTILPATRFWQLPWFGAGLTAYNLLSGKSSMGPTRILSRKQTIALMPGINPHNLAGGILYHDAQFNDARYALALARTAHHHAAAVLNYARCTELLYTGGKVSGARIRNEDPSRADDALAEATVQARVVINATGIFSDDLRRLDQPNRPSLLTVSRGSHIVVDAAFLPGRHALMVPKTEDGRVIFAIPWQGAVLVGTTDIPAKASVMEPTCDGDEIDYLLAHIAPYLARPIARADIRAIFSGLRPLVTGKENKTSKLSREHHLDASATGLITIAGGKWTTYRRMAQDTLDLAIRRKLLPPKPCRTATIPLHGCGATVPPSALPRSAVPPTASAAQWPAPSPAVPAPDPREPDRFLVEYGTDAAEIQQIEAENPHLSAKIDPNLPYTFAMVAFAVRHELARTLEDVLSRRTRALLLDAPATLRAAPAVAALMAQELGSGPDWIAAQTGAFTTLAANHYLLASPDS